jgi:catechol 2,3-dioxygenase-like lactoylglutathione lyase family enzyme
MIMENLYARTVFFVKDAEKSLRFYTEQLGMSVDWKAPPEGRVWVFQVSVFGFELILNQVDESTQSRAGHGRLFIGLEDDQIEPVRKHIEASGVPTLRVDWGQPTLVVQDLDGNELFFWDWPNKATSTVQATADRA